MDAAEFALLLFTAVNSLRVVAYVPQILKVARDQSGASAISYTTWGMFAVSHLSTVLYAVLHVQDARMATVFAANFVASCLILGLTAWKRSACRVAAAKPAI